MTVATKEQQQRGFMIYPRKGARRLFFKFPLYLWRLGLGPLLPYAVLTTCGRKSGLPRRTMIEYALINGRIYLSSGWGERADWYRNLMADNRATVQMVQTGTVYGHARRVFEEAELTKVYEHFQTSPSWRPYLDSWNVEPTLESFLANRERLVIVAIEPVTKPTLPPMERDLTWVWPVAAASVAGLWLVTRFVRRR